MSHIWHPYTRFSALKSGLPPDIVRGEGIYLIDSEGRRYVDAIASWWCVALGHSHPAIVQAIHEQSAVLQHSILGNMRHPGAENLSRALCELAPTLDRHVHFASDGASAVEAALKVALQYAVNRGEERRSEFVSLNQGYHGDTLAAMSLGFVEAFHRPFKTKCLPAHALPVPPYDLPLDDAISRAVSVIGELGNRLAGVVVEPLCQGAAGMRIYPPEYLRALYAACREAGGLFIVDEIATGFMRTGRMFAFEHADIDPDIICVGKALSAGALPISAAIVKDSVYHTFSDSPDDHTFYHGHTFAGNPVACAASLAAIREYRTPEFQRHVEVLAGCMKKRFSELQAIEGVASSRSLGLIGAVDVKPKSHAAAVQAEMRSRGYLLRPLGNVLYLMPPLIIPLEDLEQMLDDLKASLSAACNAPG